MTQQTWLSNVLKPLTTEVGKVAPGWGTTPLMAFFIVMAFLLLLILLQIYNASILLEGSPVDWSSL